MTNPPDPCDDETATSTLHSWLMARGMPPATERALLARGASSYAGQHEPFPRTPESRHLAWVLALELESRITTQSLGFRVGDEATAAASVASLFGTVRTHAAKRTIDANPVADLAQWMLNAHVRPNTARWHGLAEKGLLSAGDHSRRFRTELEQLQAVLRLWCLLFRCLSDDTRWPEDTELPPSLTRDAAATDEYDAVAAAESALHEAERSITGDGPGIGLAVSGGGIRSATFALGVLQGLIEKRGERSLPLLESLSYISTVSGGGYLGTLLAAERASGPEVALADAVQHVRAHSQDMARGWVLSLVVPWIIGITTTVAPAVVAIVGLVWLVEAANVVPLPVAVGVLGIVLTIAVAGVTRAGGRQDGVRLPAALFVAGMVGLGVLVADEAVGLVGALVPLLDGVESPALLTGILAAAGLVRRRLGMSVVLVPMFVLVLLVAAVGLQPILVGQLGVGWSVVIALAAAAWVSLPDANGLTLRHHYEQRLVDTWVRAPHHVDARLDALQGADRAPIQLWNVAVNLPGAERATLQALHGRTGDLLTLSALGAECAVDGFLPDGHVLWAPHRRAPVRVREAMSISGAALSPLMGSRTEAGVRAWLGLLNGRMGAWVRHPRDGGATGYVPGIYVVREMLGLARGDHPFVHLSDGGHVENLGVLPLLRRRCRYLIAIDGEADPGHTFDGLWRLQLRAKLDLGATLDIDTTDLELDAAGRCASHAIAVPITYDNEQTGLMIYIKLSVTGDEPQLVGGYRSQHPDFPHESTGDQVFDEAQFEAYRTLGEHIGGALTGEPWIRGEVPATLEAWVQALGARMQDEVGEGPWQCLAGTARVDE